MLVIYIREPQLLRIVHSSRRVTTGRKTHRTFLEYGKETMKDMGNNVFVSFMFL